jgi:hypothetical protein
MLPNYNVKDRRLDFCAEEIYDFVGSTRKALLTFIDLSSNELKEHRREISSSALSELFVRQFPLQNRRTGLLLPTSVGDTGTATVYCCPHIN